MLDTQRSRVGSGDTLRKLGLGVAATCLIAALSACGGGDDEAAPAAQTPPAQNPPAPNPPAPNPPPAGNQAPTIAGTPATQTMQDQQYSFTPTASDPNGDTLAFTIANRPAWATFNASTGRISGTPTSAQVGTYSNIRISVSDGTNTANLAAFSVTVVATATGSATLTWTPPTQNTDGSALTNLSGYRVYWGTSQNNLTNSVTVNNPGLATYVVDQLTPATWHFAVTALNSAGTESTQSNVASKQVL
jgi:hypothetical protein